MRSILAVVLMFAMLTASAEAQRGAKDEWNGVATKAFDVIFECFKDKGIYALKSGADEEAFAEVMMTLCKKQMDVAGAALYAAARANGHSEENARRIAKHA